MRRKSKQRKRQRTRRAERKRCGRGVVKPVVEGGRRG